MAYRRVKIRLFGVIRRRLFAVLLLGLSSPASTVGESRFHDGRLILEAPSLYERLHHPARKRCPGRPTVALALSGGGARALAQIGVLRALEEVNIPIVGIAGTSMGAIVGGLYAAGYTPAQLDSLVRTVNWASFFSDRPPRTHLLLPQKDMRARSFLALHFHGLKPKLPTAMTGGQQLIRFLTELCHAPDYHCRSNFDSLKVPFRSVATDLVSGQTVILDRGNLVMSLRAASAFPLALSPTRMDSMMLVDGGLTNPVPVDVARRFDADLVLAVNTTSSLGKESRLDNIYNVANQSTTIMTSRQREHSLSLADAVVTPRLGEISNLDFDLADTIIARGYAGARQMLDSLLAGAWANPGNSDEGEEIPIDSIVLSGLPDEGFAAYDVAVSLLKSEPPIRSTAELQGRLLQIIREGYFRRITVEVREDSMLALAEISFEPYPELNSVHFEGNTVFPDTVLQKDFARLLGQPVNARRIVAAVRHCLQLYHDQAFSLAEIREVELDRASGRLSVIIDEGRLSGLEVTGNETVKDWVITRHFPLKRGHLFNYRALLQGMEDLHASGLFSQINSRIKWTENGPLVILEVTEKDYDIVRFGLRHNLEYQTDGFVEIVNTNILGLGNEIYFHAGYCPRRERYSAGVRAARIFRTYLTAEVRAYREIHERYRYTDHRRNGFFETARNGLLLSFGQNIKRLGSVSGKFRSEDIKLTAQPPSPVATARLRSVILAARYDDLDRLPFPRHGRRANVSIEWADDFAGGEVIFRKINATVENWLSPADRVTIGQGISLGSADRVLPDYERYSLGGRMTMMGLHDDEFLGDKIVLANLYCRFQFFTRSYLNLRLDVGTVWEDGQNIHFVDHLRVAIGGGPSFDTPLGPLELFWGVTEDDYTNFYFNWGYDF